MHTTASHMDCPGCRANARVSKWVSRFLNVAIAAMLILHGAVFLAEKVATACMKDRDTCATFAGVKQ